MCVRERGFRVPASSEFGHSSEQVKAALVSATVARDGVMASSPSDVRARARERQGDRERVFVCERESERQRERTRV